jgi:hypothetical protein
MHRLLPIAFAACSGTATPTPSPSPTPTPTPKLSTPWTVPTGWKSETIPFPLDFAPAITHKGVEELRFPPGMFDPAAPGYWSYAFVWRTEDTALIAAPVLAAELTTYFRGLLGAVDEKQKKLPSLDAITVEVKGSGEGEQRFTLTAHVIDAFKTYNAIDLVGWAERRACTKGAVWIFVMSPATSGIKADLESLAAGAQCDQPLPPAKKP